MRGVTPYTWLNGNVVGHGNDFTLRRARPAWALELKCAMIHYFRFRRYISRLLTGLFP